MDMDPEKAPHSFHSNPEVVLPEKHQPKEADNIFNDDLAKEHSPNSYADNSGQAAITPENLVQVNSEQEATASSANEDAGEASNVMEDDWPFHDTNLEEEEAKDAEEQEEEDNNESETNEPTPMAMDEDWNRDEEDNWSSGDEYFESGGDFQQEYFCSPLGDESHGNRILMPASALEKLMASKIQFPMVFEITNPSSATAAAAKVSHCGVLEFSSREGSVMLPPGMMENLKLETGQLVSLKSTSLLQGTFMKIQPHTTEFIKLSNPRDVLEMALMDFPCVSSGDTIMVNHGNKKYYIDILETRPANAISLVDTDCEVEFAPPLDFKEPEKKVEAAVQEEEEEEPKFRAFSGASRRLDGLDTAMASTSSKVDKKENPASMSSKVDKKETSTEKDQQKFQPFTGKKYTLAG